MNQFMINGAGIDPFLLDPNADLNKIFFDKTGTTPGDVNFDWAAYTVTPLGLDFNTSAEFPFPAQETNAPHQSFNSFPLTEETLTGYGQMSTFAAPAYSDMTMSTVGYPMDMTVSQDGAAQPQSYDALPSQEEVVIAPAMTQSAATKNRGSAAQKKVTTAADAANGDDAPKPIRRRGARKKIRTEEEIRIKRENHLKRNRDAAQKCRARKKDSEDKRREEALALSTRNQELWGYFEGLRLEFQTLRETAFPQVKEWETEKLAACKRASEMEEDLTAKMQVMREMHDQKKLLRHVRQDSPSTVERSGSQMSYVSYADEYNAALQSTSPTSSQHNVQELGISRPVSSASNQTSSQAVATAPSPGIFQTQMIDSSNSLHLDTALSRRESTSSRSSRNDFHAPLHRDSYDSGYSNGDSSQSSKFSRFSKTDSAIDDSRGSPLEKLAPPNMMSNQRLPFFIPPAMTKGLNVGVDPAEFMAANSQFFGIE